MNTSRTRFAIVALTAALLGSLSACVVVPAPRYSAGAPVMVAPPEPRPS